MRLAILNAAVATAIAMALASTAGAATPVRLPACGSTWYGGEVAPETWDRGCTGSADLADMVWERWGARSAVGHGVTMINDCDPSCADGSVSEAPARARVSRIRRCRDDRGRVRRFYTRIWLSADGRTYDLRCRP